MIRKELRFLDPINGDDFWKVAQGVNSHLGSDTRTHGEALAALAVAFKTGVDPSDLAYLFEHVGRHYKGCFCDTLKGCCDLCQVIDYESYSEYPHLLESLSSLVVARSIKRLESMTRPHRDRAEAAELLDQLVAHGARMREEYNSKSEEQDEWEELSYIQVVRMSELFHAVRAIEARNGEHFWTSLSKAWCASHSEFVTELAVAVLSNRCFPIDSRQGDHTRVIAEMLVQEHRARIQGD